MKVVIQRVLNASVTIEGEIHNAIDKGLMILVGTEDDDAQDDIDWLVRKISGLRIFNDDNGVMNLSIKDKGYSILAISQFTLYASTKKGNRPSYLKASKPDISRPMYHQFLESLEQAILPAEVKPGIFGADMKVALINDGPVTIIIDSKNKE